MSLADALTAYAELVGDVLVNDCEIDAPSRVLRFHGHAPPDDLDCGKGILAVWWAPTITPTKLGNCEGPPVVTLHARWVRCWKIPEVDNGGVTLYDTSWDADAAELADAAECVSRALIQLSCAGPGQSGSQFVRAFLAFAVQGKATFVSAAPVGASGGVAGVEWIVTFGLRAETRTS